MLLRLSPVPMTFLRDKSEAELPWRSRLVFCCERLKSLSLGMPGDVIRRCGASPAELRPCSTGNELLTSRRNRLLLSV